ncbi:unnamed protein product [Acanthoscelides obtectus]|uniref:Uncharacterized protein n=1 Tax=Acanthoscelides obtectus TaxID=200917 RepID=A0A9P0JZD5_ACAOB|nr:unnamed protein product [Acanthoscelides obtectus]CAK1669689.1 hypothetical protein AOBTE_LOCUS27174 [Acanthoscelides obtectus]
MKSEPIDPTIPLNNLQIEQPLVIPEHSQAMKVIEPSPPLKVMEPPPPLKVIMKDGPPVAAPPLEADAQVKTEKSEADPEKELPKNIIKRKKSKKGGDPQIGKSGDASTSGIADKKTEKHVLVRKNFTKMCRNCYNFNSTRFGAKEVKSKCKRVNTYCLTCPGFPPLCVDCFIHTHKK